MSKSQFVTLSSSIPIYNSLLNHLELLLNKENQNHCKIQDMRIAISKGYEKLKLYYSKTDDSHTYTIATSKVCFNIFFDLYGVI
jgi:hypothetical protein